MACTIPIVVAASSGGDTNVVCWWQTAIHAVGHPRIHAEAIHADSASQQARGATVESQECKGSSESKNDILRVN